MRKLRLVFGCIALLVAAPASTQESVTYTYDALGRLIAARSSKTSAVDTTQYRYDPAGNRSAVATNQPLPETTDAAVFSIAAPTNPAIEGGVAEFTVVKSGQAKSSLSVSFATQNGTATEPGDYQASSGTLTFRFWETAKTVRIPVVDDGLGEPVENFLMAISAPSAGATIGTAVASAEIAASAPANQPPVPGVDSLSVQVCENASVNVLANDTDPEGNYPLTLISVGSSNRGTAYIDNGNFAFTANGIPGDQNITYVVRDSLGASSTGIVVVHTRGRCN